MAKLPERPLVDIIVDGKRYQAPQGANLHIWLNEQGFEIPYFCNHEKIPPVGACRMCLVKVGQLRVVEKEDGSKEETVQWARKLLASCMETIRPGMVVDTQDPAVDQNRKEQIEFHLINHPLECPVCDKGGECELQDWTYRYGLGQGRFREAKREFPDFVINEFIRINFKRCILCKRCVRFHSDVAKDNLMEFVHRGYDSLLVSFPDPEAQPQSKFSGNSIDICPVGAITNVVFRFRGRPWEFEHTPSIDPFDAGGTNLEVHHRKGMIMRIWPRENPEVDYGWISDKPRFAFEFVHSEHRSDFPLVKNGDGEWERIGYGEAIGLLSERIARTVEEHGPQAVAILANSILTNEELLYLRELAERIGTPNFYFGDLIDFEPELRDEAVRVLLSARASVMDVAQADTIFQFGADILEEVPVQGLFFERVQREQPINKTVSANPAPADFEREALVRVRYRPGEEIAFIGKLIEALEQGSAEGGLGRLVNRLLSSKSVALVFGDHILYGDRPAAKVLALKGLADALTRILRERHGEEFEGVSLTPLLAHGNSMGALAIGHLGLIDQSSPNQPPLREFLEELCSGKVRLLINFGRDLLEEVPDRELAERIYEQVEFVASADMFHHESHQRGHLHLPTDTFLEKRGSYLSCFMRLQKLERSDIREGLTIPDFEIIIRLLEELAPDFVYHSPEDAFKSLAERLGLPVGELEGLSDKGVQVALKVSSPEGRLEEDGGAPDGEGLLLIGKRYLFDHEPMARFSDHFFRAVREPKLLINTEDARELGIESGARVRVIGEKGELELEAKLTLDLPRGVVVAPRYHLAANLNHLQRLGMLWPRVRVELVEKPAEEEDGVADPYLELAGGKVHH